MANALMADALILSAAHGTNADRTHTDGKYLIIVLEALLQDRPTAIDPRHQCRIDTTP
jgi:hypothetical protein